MTRGREGVRGDAVCGVHVCERRAGLTDAVCVSQGPSEKYMETGVLTTSSQAQEKQYLSIHHATFHNLSIASLLK